MPGTVTIADMRTRVRRRADMENSSFVSDTELDEYIEGSYGELVDLILEHGGGDFMAASTPANPTVAGTDSYSIYSNVGDLTEALIYRVLGVEVQFNGKWRRIGRFMHWQRVSREDQNGWASQHSVKYSINWLPGPGENANIQFEPTPQAVHQFRVIYIPYPADWSTGGFTTFQGFTGWDEYIVIDAAMKCLEKEESDIQALLLRKQLMTQRIRQAVSNMNFGEGYSLRDMYEGDYIGPESLPWTTG